MLEWQIYKEHPTSIPSPIPYPYSKTSLLQFQLIQPFLLKRLTSRRPCWNIIHKLDPRAICQIQPRHFVPKEKDGSRSIQHPQTNQHVVHGGPMQQIREIQFNPKLKDRAPFPDEPRMQRAKERQRSILLIFQTNLQDNDGYSRSIGLHLYGHLHECSC